MKTFNCELCGVMLTDARLEVRERHGVQICAECAADIDEWEGDAGLPDKAANGCPHVWVSDNVSQVMYCAICGNTEDEEARP